MRLTYHQLNELYLLLSRKTGQPLEHAGFGIMSERVGGTKISQKYLYETYNQLQNRQDQSEDFNLRDIKVLSILEFLGFRSFDEFSRFLENPIPDILKSCAGTWISYVRQNSSAGIIYASPVLIYQEGQQMKYKLKGGKYLYQGEIEMKNGCLFALFRSEIGKQFHHIYQIGSREGPNLLQGIFSGVSTSNHPIGGRAVLIRSDTEFDDFKIRQLKVDQLTVSEDPEEMALGNYFHLFEKNNLRINPVITYGIEDLMD